MSASPSVQETDSTVNDAVCLGPLTFDLPEGSNCFGAAALRAAADLAQAGVDRMLERIADGALPSRAVLVGRIRGTGPGVSFGLLVRAMEVRFPTALARPFEGSQNVAGAPVVLAEVLQEQRDDAFLRLQFRAGCRDLPMHLHEFAARLIFVVGGRGFFHISPESGDEFTGRRIRHIPVRSRDVLIFPAGTVHTFSTAANPLKLLSYHPTFIPLHDARQYRVPAPAIFPADGTDPTASRVACDPAFSVFT